MSAIIIQGSARSTGNTRRVIEAVIQKHSVPIIDLLTLSIGPYDYAHCHQEDDFIPLMERVVKHEILVLATPVYWYTMSSQMKVFLDRMTDLLELRTDLLQQLRDKNVFILSSFGGSYSECFEDPFQKTCHYLGMNYTGCSMVYSGTEKPEQLAENEPQIHKARKALNLES